MNIVIIISYFIIYSFLGWILESIYKSVFQKRFINSGFLAGPFCPIYGCGALIMYLVLDRFEKNYVLLFVFGFFVLSILEYVVGWFLEIVFQTKYWDYSEKKFNIKGRICLENSLYWGVLGIIFIKIIHPFIENLIDSIPDMYLIIFVSIIGVYIMIDTITTATKLIRLNVKLSVLDELNEKIQENLQKLESIKNVNKTAVLKGIVKIRRQNKLALITLKQRREELIDKIERQTKRIRRAFPSMKSDRIFKYIKNKRSSNKKL